MVISCISTNIQINYIALLSVCMKKRNIFFSFRFLSFYVWVCVFFFLFCIFVGIFIADYNMIYCYSATPQWIYPGKKIDKLWHQNDLEKLKKKKRKRMQAVWNTKCKWIFMKWWILEMKWEKRMYLWTI